MSLSIINEDFSKKGYVGNTIYGMLLEDHIIHEWSSFVNAMEIRIPYEHSRNPKSEKLPEWQELESGEVKHYKLFIVHQDVDNTSTLVFVEYPDHPKEKYMIVVYPRGGADWHPLSKKPMYRITDRMDRRIVLGFCITYVAEICDIARYEPSYWAKLTKGAKRSATKVTVNNWLANEAWLYDYKKVPDRYKRGSDPHIRFNRTYNKAIEDMEKNPSSSFYVDKELHPDNIPSEFDYFSSIKKFDNPANTLRKASMKSGDRKYGAPL